MVVVGMPESIEKVATIVANGERLVGSITKDTFEKVGRGRC